MKFFLIYIIIIYINILTTTTKSSKKIPLANKLKIKACMILQERKYGEDENGLNAFLESKKYVFPDHPNKIVLLAMAYCYEKMSTDIANYINNINLNKLDVNRSDIAELYNIENFNYNDSQMNEKIYSKFIPVFNVVYKEMTNKESYKEFWDNYEFYFVHTKLFKFFAAFIIINTIIIFYLRFKNRSKFIDDSNNNDEDDDEDIEEEKHDDNNEKYKNKNNINHRKLKKKKVLNKNKND